MSTAHEFSSCHPQLLRAALPPTMLQCLYFYFAIFGWLTFGLLMFSCLDEHIAWQGAEAPLPFCSTSLLGWPRSCPGSSLSAGTCFSNSLSTHRNPSSRCDHFSGVCSSSIETAPAPAVLAIKAHSFDNWLIFANDCSHGLEDAGCTPSWCHAEVEQAGHFLCLSSSRTYTF